MSSRLPRAPVERLLKEHSNMRVSVKATERMAEILENIIENVSEEAAVLSRHAGRKTLIDTDIELAMKSIK